jgi:hypothetical protein
MAGKLKGLIECKFEYIHMRRTIPLIFIRLPAEVSVYN